MRHALILSAIISLALSSFGAAAAAPCKDAKGRFTKCPPAVAAVAKPKKCRDAHGHFAKCGTLGAKPA